LEHVTVEFPNLYRLSTHAVPKWLTEMRPHVLIEAKDGLLGDKVIVPVEVLKYFILQWDSAQGFIDAGAGI